MGKIEVLSEGYFLSQPDENGAYPRHCQIVRLGGDSLIASVGFHVEIGTGHSYSRIFRSDDRGKSWQDQGAMWDWRSSGKSGRLNVSRGHNGRLLGLGMLWDTPAAGETYYDRQTGGAAHTDLIFSVSDNEGVSWDPPRTIPMCYPEPPEVGGVICATRQGDWLAPFAPWLDLTGENANQGKAAVMISHDQGESWPDYAEFMEDPSGKIAYQEVWVEEMADGRVLGIAYARDMEAGEDLPIQYSISRDGGKSFCSNRSTGLIGQTTGVHSLQDGRVACAFNRRYGNPPGVGFAIARPDETDFHVEFEDILWKAVAGFREEDEDTEAMYWADFSFGEPRVETFSDGSFHVGFWCHEKKIHGSRYCHFRLR